MSWKWWQQYEQYIDQKMRPEEIAEACEDAADILEGHWCQGDWYLRDGINGDKADGPAYCVEGAIAAAIGIDMDSVYDASDFSDSGKRDVLTSCPAWRAVYDTLNEGQEPEDLEDLPNFNDTDGRVETEVLDLLRATAKRVLGVPK